MRSRKSGPGNSKGRDSRRPPPPRGPNPPASRHVARSFEDKIDALDDHLYLLAINLQDHHAGETAHLRVIAAELRTLVCESSRTEGLIWRLADELRVSDLVGLDLPPPYPALDPSVEFAYSPLIRSERHPTPVLDHLVRGDYSLRSVIKERPAVYPGPAPLTFDEVIKFVAQQIGTAHESEDIRVELPSLRRFFLASRGIHAKILCEVADLALEVGWRVLDEAVHARGYRIKPRRRDVQGDVRATSGA